MMAKLLNKSKLLSRRLLCVALVVTILTQVTSSQFTDQTPSVRAICFHPNEASRRLNMYLMSVLPELADSSTKRVCCPESTYNRIKKIDKHELETHLRNYNSTSVAQDENDEECYVKLEQSYDKHHVLSVHKRAAPPILTVARTLDEQNGITTTIEPTLPPLLIEVSEPNDITRMSLAQRIYWPTYLISGIILSLTIVYFYMNNPNERYHELLVLFCTILISGFGNLGAGAVLNVVQHWDVFIRVSELLVLEPTLLGLKGNIEMCMAARLATQANLGNMNTWPKTFRMVWGNLALDLTQATVVSSFAAIGVVIFTYVQNSSGNFGYSLAIVFSTTLLTACTASIFLGSLLVTVIIISYKLKVNPDNIGAPVAASFGDLITLSLLATYGSLIYHNAPLPPKFPVMPFVAIVSLLALGPLWFFLAYKNEYTRPNIGTGWLPIFIAVILSTCSGFILDYAAFEYRTFALFQPVINGVGGNLVAIHSSRMSTALHKQASLGDIPADVKMFRSPMQAFFDKSEINIEMARNLVLMALPAHIIYLYVTVSVQGNTALTTTFIVCYLAAALLQVLILLYLAYHLVNLMWKQGIDPDNAVIPILTATGDFLGSLFLFISFLFLDYIGDINTSS